MSPPYRLLPWFLSIVCLLPSAARCQSVSLTDAQIRKLAQIVHADAEAGKLFEQVKHTADEALTAAPDPIEKIQTEGKLPADPVRVQSIQSLRDMKKLEALGDAYAVTGEARYADKVRQFILAWARTNHSAGDPIDDTSLEPLIVAYDLTRATFSAADREKADAYLRDVAVKEQESARKHADNHFNNWHSHRLKVIGLVAFALHDKPMIEYIVAAYKAQIDHNLHPDGSSLDFHERDALHYHVYDLAPLLSLATAARNNGIELYPYQSPKGGSLAKGVAFLLPFVEGKKTHAEFVGSKVAFDRKRAEAGDKHYQAGTPFEPRSAISTLERAELFDPALRPLLIRLARPEAKKFPGWQTVLNDARR